MSILGAWKASLYWIQLPKTLIMEESFGSNTSRESRQSLTGMATWRRKRNADIGEVDKTGNNQIAEGLHCVVGRTM